MSIIEKALDKLAEAPERVTANARVVDTPPADRSPENLAGS